MELLNQKDYYLLHTFTDGFMKIEIPDNLYAKISDRVDQSNFESVEVYVKFVLGEVVKEHPELSGEPGNISEEREEKVRENLKSLGYLE